MLTLFHAPRSRSSRIIWLLEELGAPYELKISNIRRGDGSGAVEETNPHPHGKVPAIVHDGVPVFESAAICTYLTDAFPANRIGPQVGDPKRGPYLTWLAYYTGVLEPAFMSKFMNITPPRGTAGWVVVEEAMEHVNAALEKGPWLLGDTFSAADVLYGSTFALFLGNPMLPETPPLRAYVDRCAARPAYQRAAAKEEG
ncbi:MAG: glutathione S-transferase family protein [Hyphomonadaceae bacterium]